MRAGCTAALPTCSRCPASDGRVLEQKDAITAEFEASEVLGLGPQLRGRRKRGVPQVVPQVDLQLLVNLLLVGRVSRRRAPSEQIIDLWVGVFDKARVGTEPGEEA